MLHKNIFIMSKIYIGLDNGVSGTIGVVGDGIDPIFTVIPTKVEQNYTKTKQDVHRLDVRAFANILSQFDARDITILMERPMINPGLFKSSISAARCFEAELAIIELLQLKHMYVDSKDWQKVLLPKGTKGSDELKKASLDIGNRLFPQFADNKHKDRDGILIAEYGRRMNL